MKKREVSILLNILIILFEIIGFIIIYKNYGGIDYEYYTEDSNILALFSSIIYVFFLLINKKIPKWISVFKYMTTICLSVTFFVVLFVLIPMDNFNFYGLLIKDAFVFQHLICPLLSIITFVFFDNLGEYTKKDTLFGLNLTVIYSIVLSVLNVLGTVRGPYPFLMIREQSLFESVMWYIVMISFAYLIAFSLRKLYFKFNLKYN